MDRANIPGFYFDPEKKKYFKILPNHVAPTGAKYSREGIKRGREGEKKRKLDAEHQVLHQQRVQHPGIMQHPLGGPVALSRELGFCSRSQRRGAPGNAYACGLLKRTELRILPESGLGEVAEFARDEVTGGYVMGVNVGGCGMLQSFAPDQHGDGTFQYSDRGGRMILPNMCSEISSVNISRTRTLIATTLGGTTRPTIHLSKLVEPEILDSTWPWLDIGITVLLRPSTETSIWTSLPSPQSSTPTIALGTSHGINILTEAPSDWVEGRTLTTSSDVFALEWMDANGVLAAGCRNGSVRIYDQRGKKKIGMELRHGSAVTAVRRVDEWRVVVCGLESRLNMYDLRFTKHPPRSQPPSFHHKTTHTTSLHSRPITKPPTTPLLTYHQHLNPHTQNLGFDIDTSLNLVAAATSPLFPSSSSSSFSTNAPSTDSEAGNVNLYALHTGELIRSFPPRHPAHPSTATDRREGIKTATDAEGAEVRCIRFSTLDRDKSARGLVMARGGRLEEWSW